jgi:hypothetical protein
MAIQQNQGSPVPKGGIKDNRKYTMDIVRGLGGGASANPGSSVGTGSGVKGGGTLGGKSSGKKSKAT